jgi:ketosteroid isomerase-like protein
MNGAGSRHGRLPDTAGPLFGVRDTGQAMSQENVEVVRRAIEAFSIGDLDGAAQMADPDIEVDWSKSGGVEAGVYRGPAQVRRFWATFYDVFERIEVLLEELIEHGDHVIVCDRSRFWGRDGIEVAVRTVAVVTLRDGRITAWRLCRDKDEALDAAGLTP